jgi:cytochrome c oxidase subunit 2
VTWFPEDVSTNGHLIDSLFRLAFLLICVAFTAVIGLLLSFLVLYRERKGHRPFYAKGDTPKALALTLSLALVVFLAIDVNLAMHDSAAWDVIWKKPDLSKALELRIEPQQFAWNGQYAGPDGVFDTADDVRVINALHVPVNRPIFVSLRSRDVIHSFCLPNFRIKQDAVPGVTTHLTFEGVKTGVYDIACAQHCGIGHYRMRGELTVETAEEFNKWIAENSGKGPAQ